VIDSPVIDRASHPRPLERSLPIAPHNPPGKLLLPQRKRKRPANHAGPNDRDLPY
jgi:hypothetical protein